MSVGMGGGPLVVRLGPQMWRRHIAPPAGFAIARTLEFDVQAAADGELAPGMRKVLLDAFVLALLVAVGLWLQDEVLIDSAGRDSC